VAAVLLGMVGLMSLSVSMTRQGVAGTGMHTFATDDAVVVMRGNLELARWSVSTRSGLAT
jgi:hypothetical protein